MDADQLAHVEALANTLFSATSSGPAKVEAQQALLMLQSSADYIPQCQSILDYSVNPFAHLVAAQSLEKLITQFWNNFTVQQKADLCTYVLTYLGEKGVMLEDVVIGELAKLTCRITKLGWFDDMQFREIIQEITRFLQATLDHHLIGLRILCELVDEMNAPTSGRTLTQHRKTAVSFRDHSLFRVFQIAITTLKHLQVGVSGASQEQEHSMGHLALKLAVKCLSFDFIGTNPDESGEDVGTVQVPSSWRPLVQDQGTIQLFFNFYKNTVPPQSSQAIEALVQLSSIRRSLFSTEKERGVFLGALMEGIQEIMSTKQGMEHPSNYHEFCRLLGRLKANYQLSELVKTPVFTEWLTLGAGFTIKSLHNWQYSQNSIHYLLTLWGRLVAALPYMHSDTDSQRQADILRQCVVQVLEAYIQTMIGSVEVVVRSNGAVDDPLTDEGTLREQMERLPVLARSQYADVSAMLMTLYEQHLGQYHEALSLSVTGPELIIIEGKLTWLTYMVAAIIGASGANDPRRGVDDQRVDGNLSRPVMQLIQGIDYRLNSSNGQAKSDPKLELAILFYFRMFKKIYLTDHLASPSLLGAVTGARLSLALTYATLDPKKGQDLSDGAHQDFFNALGIADMNTVMNVIVTKMCNNIKYWNDEEEILAQTLEVFSDLVSTYASCKALLALDTVRFLVYNHTGDHFPFLSYAHNNKHRINFYQALSRLVFSSAEDINNSFDSFIEPNLELLAQLNQTANLRQESVKIALIAIYRDLRGITAATHNKRTYNLLFDHGFESLSVYEFHLRSKWCFEHTLDTLSKSARCKLTACQALYPDYFPVFVRTAETWYDDPDVMTALLKFLNEFVFNKGQRVQFDQSSPNGILLFRGISSIITAYGGRILQSPVTGDMWQDRYKGIRLMLAVLHSALSGNYVNFGVFGLYNDKALENALDVSLQLFLSIPLNDVNSFVKLSRACYNLLEILFRNHLDVLSALDSPVVIQLIKTLHEGLQTSEQPVCTTCANAVDHLATYIFLNQHKGKPAVQMMKAHIQTEPEILTQLMTTLFNQLLFGVQANQWSITRPILSLMLASEQAFTNYKDQLIASQSPENQAQLEAEFSRLVSDLQTSVESSNRDKFTQRLTLFRLKVRDFLTL